MSIKLKNELTIGSDEWSYLPLRFNVGKLNAVADVMVKGTSPLSLPNAEADGLRYLKLFGACEQSGTPTAENPLPIVCNNGVVGLTGYTVIGTLSITENLVASGFSSSNYINAGIFTPLTNTWEIAGKFNAQSAGATQIVFARTKSTYFGIRMMISQAAKISLEASSNGTSNMVSVTSDLTINYNTDYWFRVRFTGTQYTVDLSTDNTNWTNYITENNSTPIYDDSTNTLQIGAKGNQYFRGSIDLKEFKIIIGDIPYYKMELGKFNDTPFFACDLLAVGDYVDEQNLITGVVTRRCESFVYDGEQTVNTPYISTTGGLDVGAIIVHPLDTPTTENVTAQTLNTVNGTNTVTITQAALDDLRMEVKYSKR